MYVPLVLQSFGLCFAHDLKPQTQIAWSINLLIQNSMSAWKPDWWPVTIQWPNPNFEILLCLSRRTFGREFAKAPFLCVYHLEQIVLYVKQIAFHVEQIVLYARGTEYFLL